MYKIYSMLRRWLLDLLEPVPAPDPLDRLSPLERADLPAHHPATDGCVSA